MTKSIVLNPVAGVTYAASDVASAWLSSGAWDTRTVGELLNETTSRHPEKIAVVSGDREICFSELESITTRLAGALLDLGARPGDRALFQMGNCLEAIFALLACSKAGIIPVCTLAQFREIEMTALGGMSRPTLYFVQDNLGKFDLVQFALGMSERIGGIRALITAQSDPGRPGTRIEDLCVKLSEDEASALLQNVHIGPGDVLTFQLSGGTTGVPKIIPRFHGEYIAHSAAWAAISGKTADSIAVWNLPLIHNAGTQWALMPLLSLGRTLILQPRIDMKLMFDAIERYKVTHAFSIGPIAPAILGYESLREHDLSSLVAFSGLTGAQALEQRLGLPCSNTFGITEGLLLASSPDLTKQIRHFSCGRPITPFDEVRVFVPGTEKEVAVGEVGEICFRGPYTLKGYYRAPEITAASFSPSGFFRSGDLMRRVVVDDIDCYAFEGRIKDNIDRGGEKFGVEEVETLISEHDDIVGAAVVAMPCRTYGERACAFLVIRSGGTAPGVAELGSYLTGRGLAKFKLPERIETLDTLPVTRAGKLDKAILRSRIAATLAEEELQSGMASAHG